MYTHLFVAEWHRMSSTPDVPSPSIDTKRVLVVIFGTVAVLAGSRIAYKYISQGRWRAREVGVKRQLAAGRRAKARERDLCEAQLCVVCVDNPKGTILLPCGHVCLCRDCSDRITEYCPICRERIQSRALAFIT